MDGDNFFSTIDFLSWADHSGNIFISEVVPSLQTDF